MSVKGWEFRILACQGSYQAFGSSGHGSLYGKFFGSVAEAEADLPNVERSALASELAGRGVDVEEMANYLRERKSDETDEFHDDWLAQLLATFDAALAEVEGTGQTGNLKGEE